MVIPFPFRRCRRCADDPRGAEATSTLDITDGTANTLLVVEIANSGIHWMEPRDLHVLQMAPTINPKAGQGFSSRHTGGAHGLACEGSVRFFSETTTADSLRAWLTARGADRADEW